MDLPPLETRPTWLYQLRDEASEVVYVGITVWPWERIRHHLWFGERGGFSARRAGVTIRTVDWCQYPDRAQAADAEHELIQRLHPRLNGRHQGADSRFRRRTATL